MLNINELEARWLRYKIKSFLPHIIIFFSLLIIVIILIQVDFNKTKPLKEKVNKNIISVPKTDITIEKKEVTQNTIIEKNNTLAQNKKIEQIVKKIPHSIPKENDSLSPLKTKLLVAPSLGFLDSIKENSPSHYSNYIEPYKTTKKNTTPKKALTPKIKPSIVEVPATKKIIQKPIVEVQEIKEDVQTQTLEKVQAKEIQIKRQNTQDDIQHVVKRFKTSNNPALSLFIAKKYYELGNYNQSYNYALMTNELNNDIEESWIIFAKSLYKLNKKDKAIAILQKYIDASHSHRAKVLLDNIKTGKLK